MKPAYEIVRAAELRVGDVFKADARNADEVVLDVEPETETVTTQSGPWGFKRLVARQLPPERNPEVLMRALEIATQTHIEVFPETAFRTAGDWIEYAREMMESEAGK